MSNRRVLLPGVLALGLVQMVLLAGCPGQPATPTSGGPSAPAASGRTITEIGSTTVLPVAQKWQEGYNKTHPDIQISVGIGWGPTLVLERDMWGAEFNLASKLGEDLAGAGEVLLTSSAHRALGRSPYAFRRRTVTVSGMPYNSYLLRWHARAVR